MDMIKKIAVTASIMLFVLAQIFSLYVIQVSRTEKLNLLKDKEAQILQKNIRNFEKDMQNINYKDSIDDYLITWFFQKNMPENSALYKGKQELCNKSSYDFDAGKLKGELNVPSFLSQHVNGKYLLVIHETIQIGTQNYTVCYLLDATFIYKSSQALLIREILVSLFLSGITLFVLVFLIRRITKPLQAANEAQLLLIGSMSHELKTPLTAICGYSETLLDVKLSDEQRKKSLEYIHSESGRLSRLSEKMMELTKLYEPDCVITFTPVCVKELFDAAEKSVRSRLEEKKLQLVREGTCRDIKMDLDYDLMVSFLINLLNNSIMASKPGGRIFLGAGKNEIWVRDEGCGIPKKELYKVCQAFYRVDKSRSRKSGNMGLGLALCEQIAKAHNAKLRIESEEGKGTKISLYKSFTTH